MADIFRAPLFSRQHRRPDPAQTWSGPNLLLSTLFVAAAALPFNNASAFTGPQHASHGLAANADTSKGTPKTLTIDALAPLVTAPFVVAQHKRVIWSETSKGTPLELFPVAVAGPPFVVAPTIQADAKIRREVRSDVPPNLQTQFAPDQVASGVPESLTIYRVPARPTDTSFRSATLDLVVTPQAPTVFRVALISKHHRVPVTPTNTGFRNAAVLDLVVPPAPLVGPPFVTPPTLPRINADTTQDTPKTLFADSVAPFFVPANFAPVLQGKSGYLHADTSRGTPKTLTADAAVPVFNPPQLLLDKVRPVADTSRGYTPFPTVAPFSNPPTLLLDKARIGSETTQDTALVLLSSGVKPFAQYDWPQPIEYRLAYESKWDGQAFPDAIPPALPVVPPAPVEDTSGGSTLYPGYSDYNNIHWGGRKKVKDESPELPALEEPSAELAPIYPPATKKGKRQARLRAEQLAKQKQQEADDEEMVIRLISELL